VGVVVYLLIRSTRLFFDSRIEGPVFSEGLRVLSGHFSSFRGLILSSNFVSLYTFDSYGFAYLTSVSCLGQDLEYGATS
jgi:hypothetical protein